MIFHRQYQVQEIIVAEDYHWLAIEATLSIISAQPIFPDLAVAFGSIRVKRFDLARTKITFIGCNLPHAQTDLVYVHGEQILKRAASPNFGESLAMQ